MLEFSAAALLACILMRPVHRIHRIPAIQLCSRGAVPCRCLNIPCFDELGVSESGVYNTHCNFNRKKSDKPCCFPIILRPKHLNLRPCAKFHSQRWQVQLKWQAAPTGAQGPRNTWWTPWMFCSNAAGLFMAQSLRARNFQTHWWWCNPYKARPSKVQIHYQA